MKTEYTMSFSKQFKHYGNIFIFLFLDVIFVFYMAYEYGSQDLYLYIKIAFGLFSIMCFPTLYVHLEYYLKNRNDKLSVNDSKSLMEYEHKKNTILLNFDDIKKLEQYKTPPLIEKRWAWLPWASYNYVKITLNDSRQLIITCYLVNEFKLPIDKSKIKLHKVMYPNIKN